MRIDFEDLPKHDQICLKFFIEAVNNELIGQGNASVTLHRFSLNVPVSGADVTLFHNRITKLVEIKSIYLFDEEGN